MKVLTRCEKCTISAGGKFLPCEDHSVRDIAAGSSSDSSKKKRSRKLISSSCKQKGRKRRKTAAKLVHVCDECGRCFKSKSRLRAHKVTHTGEKPHECENCGKAFGRRSHLTRHMKIHSGEKPFECDECGRCFSERWNLKKHKNSIHNKDAVDQSTNLNQYNERDDTLYVWDESSKSFTQHDPHIGNTLPVPNKNGTNHSSSITAGEKRFKCHLCDKSFALQTGLSKHKKIHKGLKPHACTECGKCFLERCNLRQHMQTHTGEKPYKCDCGKSFTRRSHLTRHKKTHTGEKPYECDQCDKRFAERWNLKQHIIKSHTPTKLLYACV